MAQVGGGGDLVGKIRSSIHKAMEHALNLDPNCGPEGAASSYATALRCRLEIQYALLLIQRGLSIRLEPARAVRGGVDGLAESLRVDLSRAASLLGEGSIEGAGAALMSSDAKVAGIISLLRRRLRLGARAGFGAPSEPSPEPQPEMQGGGGKREEGVSDRRVKRKRRGRAGEGA